MDEEILFGSDQKKSLREEYFSETIFRVRESIIRACGKCKDGFIEKEPVIKSVDDLAYRSAVECACRGRAEKVSKMIASGIPLQFQDGQMPLVDAESKAILETYEKKIDKAMEKGLGLIFYGACDESLSGELAMARSMAAIRILTVAIEKGMTAHFLSMSEYFRMARDIIRRDDEFQEALFDEIREVDFLCIDNLGSLNLTDFVLNAMEDLIRSRSLALKPTLLITRLHEENFCQSFGKIIFSLIKCSSVKVEICEFHNRDRRGYSSVKELG